MTTSNVVELGARRPASSSDPLVCACGSHWFDLRLDEDAPGAVTLSVGGSVTGYAGVPVCRECGRNAY